MRQSSKRFVSSILAIIFLFASFVVFFNFIKPAYNNIEELKGKLASESQFISKQENIVNKVKELISSYKNEDQIKETASFILPVSPDAGGALAQLNWLLNSNNLSEQSFSINVPSLDTIVKRNKKENTPIIMPVGKFSVKIRFSGEYQNFKKFLSQLETNIRIFNVENIDMSQMSGKGNENLYNFNMSVESYYQTK